MVRPLSKKIKFRSAIFYFSKRNKIGKEKDKGDMDSVLEGRREK